MWLNGLLLVSLFRATVSFELTPSSRHFEEAVSGSTVVLDCTLSAVLDRPSLVLWYRDYSTKPFYSFDAREQAGNARHKVHEDWRHLGARTNFTFRPGLYTKEKQAAVVGSLTLANVSLEDAGNYTCRVDFHTAQTAMTLVTLSVIEGVRRLSVVDGDGREVGGLAGPYTEGQTLRLLCTAAGGHPPPAVVWMMDGKPVPQDADSIFRTSTQATQDFPPDPHNDTHSSPSEFNESKYVLRQKFINASGAENNDESFFYTVSNKKKRFSSDASFRSVSKILDKSYLSKSPSSLPLHRHLHFRRPHGFSDHLFAPSSFNSLKKSLQKRYLQFPPIRLRTHRSPQSQEPSVSDFNKKESRGFHTSYAAAWQSNLHKMTYFSPTQVMSQRPSIPHPLVTESELSSLTNLSSTLQASSKSNWSEVQGRAVAASYKAVHPPGVEAMSKQPKNEGFREVFVPSLAWTSMCLNGTWSICTAGCFQKSGFPFLFIAWTLSRGEALRESGFTKEKTKPAQVNLLVIALRASATDTSRRPIPAKSSSDSTSFNASAEFSIFFCYSNETICKFLRWTSASFENFVNDIMHIVLFRKPNHERNNNCFLLDSKSCFLKNVTLILAKFHLTAKQRVAIVNDLNNFSTHFDTAHAQTIQIDRKKLDAILNALDSVTGHFSDDVRCQKAHESFLTITNALLIKNISQHNKEAEERLKWINFLKSIDAEAPSDSGDRNYTNTFSNLHESSITALKDLMQIYFEDMPKTLTGVRNTNTTRKCNCVFEPQLPSFKVDKESLETSRETLPLSFRESSQWQLENDFKMVNVASASYLDSKQAFKLRELDRKQASPSLLTNYKQKSQPRVRGNSDSKKAINSKFRAGRGPRIIWPRNALSDVVPEIPAKKRVLSVDVQGLLSGARRNSTQTKSKHLARQRKGMDPNDSALRFPTETNVEGQAQNIEQEGNSVGVVVPIEKKSRDRTRRAQSTGISFTVPRFIDAGDDVKKRFPRAGRGGPPITARRQSAEEEVNESRVTAALHIGPLTRADNDKVFSCRADNSQLTKPKARLVKITMILPPLGVTIITPTVGGLAGVAGVVGVMAGREGVLVCRGEGSIPPAVVTWSPSSLVTPFSSQPTMDSTATVSRARILATAKDDGRVVTCTATNPQLPHYTVTATHTLQVKYPPEVEARLAPALDPHSIKEGDDVYFECDVQANPPASSVQWIHRDAALQAGERGNLSRVLLHGRSLVLQGVTRRARGAYACRATNALGSVTSAPVLLNVMYPPVCRDPPNQTIAIAPGQPTKLVCKVDSYPKQVRFRWAVNTSRGLAHVDPSKYRSKETSSYLIYKPQISLSQEAEERRKTYYMSQKRGFHATDSSGSNRAVGFKANGFIETENEKARKVRSAVFENYQTGENVNRSGISSSVFQSYDENNELKTFFGSKKNWFDLEQLERNEDQRKLSSFVSDSKENLNYLTTDGAKSPGLTPFVDESKFATPPAKNSQAGQEATLGLDAEEMELEETYGVVYCWGENAQGKQQQPCVITVTPAGPPSPIRACRILNQTATALQVLCRPGADGGLKQTFVAVVKDERTGEVAGNTSSPHPLLTLPGLTAGTGYVVQVWTFNARGASKPFVLEGYALKVAENKIDDSQTSASGSHVSLLFAAAVAGCALVVACLLAALRFRRRRCTRPPRSESDDAPKTSVSDNEGEEEDDNETVRDDRQTRDREALDHPSCSGPDLLMRTDSSAVPLFTHLQSPAVSVPISTKSNLPRHSHSFAQSNQVRSCKHYECETHNQPPTTNVAHKYQHHRNPVQRPHTPSNYSQAQFLVLAPQDVNAPEGFMSGDNSLGSSFVDKSSQRKMQKPPCDGCDKLPNESSDNNSTLGAFCQLPTSSSVSFNLRNMPSKKTEKIPDASGHRCECNGSKQCCEYAPSVCTSVSARCDSVPEKSSVRQPTFQYATICRSFALASNDEFPSAKSSQRFLPRGLSSHELLPKGSLEPNSFLDPGCKSSDAKCGTVDDSELMVARRRSTACEDTRKPIAQIWAQAGAPCQENKSDRDSSRQEYKSRNCRASRADVGASLGEVADKGTSDHTHTAVCDKTGRLNTSAAAPVQCVADLPRVKRDSHQYYTLKVNSARQNSESFV